MLYEFVAVGHFINADVTSFQRLQIKFHKKKKKKDK